jgi:hypothetical protein
MIRKNLAILLNYLHEHIPLLFNGLDHIEKWNYCLMLPTGDLDVQNDLRKTGIVIFRPG